MNWSQGVSGAVGLLCLVGAALMYTIGGGRLPRVIVILVLTGVAGLGGAVGHWLHVGVSKADSAISHVIGRFTGATVIGLVAIVAVVYLAFGLIQKRADRLVIAAAVVAVVAVNSIPGPAGDMASSAMGGLTGAVGTGVGLLFGMG